MKRILIALARDDRDIRDALFAQQRCEELIGADGEDVFDLILVPSLSPELEPSRPTMHHLPSRCFYALVTPTFTTVPRWPSSSSGLQGT